SCHSAAVSPRSPSSLVPVITSAHNQMVAGSPGIGSSDQMRAVLSSEAVTMRRPSGLNLGGPSLAVCPWSAPVSWPLDASRTLAAPSGHAVTTCEPVGSNATDRINPLLTLNALRLFKVVESQRWALPP